MDAQGIRRYRSWLLANPSAFVGGVQGFCKQAESESDDSLWNELKPWVIALGAGGLGLLGGEWWGRYANKTGNKLGAIKGPLAVGLGKLLPSKYKPVFPQDNSNGQG